MMDMTGTPVRRSLIAAQSTPLSMERDDRHDILSTPDIMMKDNMRRNSEAAGMLQGGAGTPSGKGCEMRNAEPQTPTPVKNALAELQKEGASLKHMVSFRGHLPVPNPSVLNSGCLRIWDPWRSRNFVYLEKSGNFLKFGRKSGNFSENSGNFVFLEKSGNFGENDEEE